MSAAPITTQAINNCSALTTQFEAALASLDKTRKDHDDLMVEYNRRRSVYDSAMAMHKIKCTGNCASYNGSDYYCDPVCRNLLHLNPIEPYKPDPIVVPGFGSFICQICEQNVNIDANAGRDAIISGINQQMSCIASAEGKLSSEEAAKLKKEEDARIAKEKEAALIAKENEENGNFTETNTNDEYENENEEYVVPTDEQNLTDEEAAAAAKKKKIIIVIIGFIAIIFIIIVILIAMSMRKKPAVGARMKFDRMSYM
jgi:hypothetical protein